MNLVNSKESVDVNNINVKVSDETSELCTISVKLKFEKRVCTSNL